VSRRAVEWEGPAGAVPPNRADPAADSTVALEMVATNEVAKRFYEKEGFTTTFVEMHRSL